MRWGTVNWSAPAGHSSYDWVGLFQVGGGTSSYLAYQYTGSATSGSMTFTAPSTAGGCRRLAIHPAEKSRRPRSRRSSQRQRPATAHPSRCRSHSKTHFVPLVADDAPESASGENHVAAEGVIPRLPFGPRLQCTTHCLQMKCRPSSTEMFPAVICTSTGCIVAPFSSDVSDVGQ